MSGIALWMCCSRGGWFQDTNVIRVCLSCILLPMLGGSSNVGFGPLLAMWVTGRLRKLGQSTCTVMLAPEQRACLVV